MDCLAASKSAHVNCQINDRIIIFKITTLLIRWHHLLRVKFDSWVAFSVLVASDQISDVFLFTNCHLCFSLYYKQSLLFCNFSALFWTRHGHVWLPSEGESAKFKRFLVNAWTWNTGRSCLHIFSFIRILFGFIQMICKVISLFPKTPLKAS